MKTWLAAVLGGVLAAGALSVHPSARQAAPKPAASLVVDTSFPEAAVIADRKREAERRRLFRSDAPLPMTLKADFRAVNRDRNQESETTFPATLSFPANDGSTTTMPLRIRTRGHSRRYAVTCTFAPLLLEMEKPATKGTVFDGHGPLKLGTHCRTGSEDIILREYVFYRMYSLLTPRSFRTRVTQMTYLDSATGKTVAEEAGLLLEDDDDVAKRMEGRIVELTQAIFPRVDRETLVLMMLFQYMIGNTDLSIMVQHNIRLVQTQDFKRYPVPYDFDYSGIVDAAYARPAPNLPITNVRDRLYRGPCLTPAEWQPFLDRMKTVKPQFMELLESTPGLKPGYRKSAKSYLEEAYRIFDSPPKVKIALIDPCQKIGM